jgi:anti-sigma-K factor RskA
MTMPDDKIALAAEYVLGTLDAAEREEAAAAIQSDPDFAALVRGWEKRLGELHAMVDAVEPPPATWERIKARLPDAPQGALRLPDLPPAPPGGRAAGADVVALEQRLARWRGGAAVMGALAAGLAGLVVISALQPPPQPRVVEVVKEVVKEVPAPAAGRFVAVLQRDAASPAFIMTVDLAAKSMTVRRVAAEEQPGKSYELWLVSDRFPAPRSLGVVGASEFTRSATLASYEPDIISGATFAVSLEPENGSPTGAPTGPVLWVGKLVESVPPQAGGR